MALVLWYLEFTVKFIVKCYEQIRISVLKVQISCIAFENKTTYVCDEISSTSNEKARCTTNRYGYLKPAMKVVTLALLFTAYINSCIYITSRKMNPAKMHHLLLYIVHIIVNQDLKSTVYGFILILNFTKFHSVSYS